MITLCFLLRFFFPLCLIAVLFFCLLSFPHTLFSFESLPMVWVSSQHIQMHRFLKSVSSSWSNLSQNLLISFYAPIWFWNFSFYHPGKISSGLFAQICCFPDALYSFIVHSFVFGGQKGYIVVNFLGLCISENVSILSSYLKKWFG